jgi:hypothetical protein
VALSSSLAIGSTLLEMVLGYPALLAGTHMDATPFSTQHVFSSVENGSSFKGTDTTLYSGYTGRELGTDVTLGWVYFSRLSTDVLDMDTEMESVETAATHALVAHGMSYLLQESILVRQNEDPFWLAICNHTGTVAVYNAEKRVFLSPMVDGPIVFGVNADGSECVRTVNQHGRSFSLVRVPRAFLQLMQELQTLHIQLRLITDDNIHQYMSLGYSANVQALMHMDPTTDLRTTLDTIVNQVQSMQTARLSQQVANRERKAPLKPVRKPRTTNTAPNNDMMMDDPESIDTVDNIQQHYRTYAAYWNAPGTHDNVQRMFGYPHPLDEDDFVAWMQEYAEYATTSYEMHIPYCSFSSFMQLVVKAFTAWFPDHVNHPSLPLLGRANYYTKQMGKQPATMALRHHMQQRYTRFHTWMRIQLDQYKKYYNIRSQTSRVSGFEKPIVAFSTFAAEHIQDTIPTQDVDNAVDNDGDNTVTNTVDKDPDASTDDNTIQPAPQVQDDDTSAASFLFHSLPITADEQARIHAEYTTFVASCPGAIQPAYPPLTEVQFAQWKHDLLQSKDASLCWFETQRKYNKTFLNKRDKAFATWANETCNDYKFGQTIARNNPKSTYAKTHAKSFYSYAIHKIHQDNAKRGITRPTNTTIHPSPDNIAVPVKSKPRLVPHHTPTSTSTSTLTRRPITDLVPSTTATTAKKQKRMPPPL